MSNQPAKMIKSSAAKLREVLHRTVESADDRLFHLRHHSSFLSRASYIAEESERLRLLKGLHDRYTNEISSRGMAISLKLASLLLHICRQTQPKVILDLGSGFSSLVFRIYAAEASTVVYSVDDDPLWLDKTRAFIGGLNLSQENFVEWSEFQRAPIKADLILHDLGRAPQRCGTMPLIPRYGHKQTLGILDDVHKKNVRCAAKEMVRSHQLRYEDLKDVSIDHYGRYQWLVFGFSENL